MKAIKILFSRLAKASLTFRITEMQGDDRIMEQRLLKIQLPKWPSFFHSSSGSWFQTKFSLHPWSFSFSPHPSLKWGWLLGLPYTAKAWLSLEDPFLFFSFFFFSVFLGLHPQHKEVPRPGVSSELLPLAYATATATPRSEPRLWPTP